jgi:hypothetical protein
MGVFRAFAEYIEEDKNETEHAMMGMNLKVSK